MKSESYILNISFLLYSKIIVLFLFLFTFTFFISCISIRVYIPQKGTDVFDIGNVDTIPHFAVPRENPNFEVIESQETNGSAFATRDPSLFFLAPRKLENEYGSVKTLILRELDRNRKDYKVDQKYKILIKNFELKTNDRCFFGSMTAVNLEIDVIRSAREEKILEFHFEDSIDSNVTDCNFTLATATIVGWLIYMPYLGFRGNREDQLNQLGRIALLEFSERLKSSLEKSSVPRTEKK
ncbi:hypothetical protein JWG44_14060 [Leptospira sp. 201903071]|uniref:hypothetical protein n=1 Tax=Leptospira ainazelensis TaxID=2810034 RepID=UPI00196462D1|nr:hypothetical protein [Leptospira ainazelensis]MBM9501377.1 hypothetical protein [Leptospira ainazelensis]